MEQEKGTATTEATAIAPEILEAPEGGNMPVPVGIKQELAALQPQVAAALPEQITPEKFMRVVMTALVRSPELGAPECRRSLLTAAVQAAQDGLLPDGREGAFVIYKNKVKGRDGAADRWEPRVQWMPMVAGIRKKIYNSGEVLSLTAQVVFERDEFKHWTDDAGEHLLHKPEYLAAERGKPVLVYAIARLKGDATVIEVMTAKQIGMVQSVSKSGDRGPWNDWPEEMWRKSVVKRIAKSLPMNTDVQVALDRDNELYELRKASESARDAFSALRNRLQLPAPATDGEQGGEQA
jgi:recombination protein RecT